MSALILALPAADPAPVTHADSPTRLIVAAILGIAAIVVLIVWCKMHPFLALTLGSAVLAVAAGIPLADTFTAFTTGLGATIGSVGTLIAFGAIIGRLLIDSGGADQIVDTILARMPGSRLPWAMALIAFVVGIPLFFEVGIVLLIPLLDRAVTVDLRILTLDVPVQEVITKDNVAIKVNAVVYFRVLDPSKSVVEVENYIVATSQLAQTTLRSVVGSVELDEVLSSREKINQELQEIIDERTDPWGIKVNRVELKNILPPDAIREAMEKQMKAEREKREAITLAEAKKQSAVLTAEGNKQAAILNAEADKQKTILAAEAQKEKEIREAEGRAQAIRSVKEAEAEGIRLIRQAGADDAVLKLRSLEAFASVANGRATKIIIPSDLQNMGGLLAGLKETLDTPIPEKND